MVALTFRDSRFIVVRYFCGANQPLKTSQFGQSLTSELEGNPPLWVTRKRGPGFEDIYINNAKIIGGSEYEGQIGRNENEKRKQESPKNLNEILPRHFHTSTERHYGLKLLEILRKSSRKREGLVYISFTIKAGSPHLDN
ncbi:hypothetical protein QAD02_008844 [Eretmocerus hayati]|uniref:Uncharacterized protein n=1 Tax=Eretmocerus hayati TaxID=131215 RepID=A0ACC2NA14_9HYME|nr:hypothetical protein QAD02_008844 [Eretmocerus hayati]